MSHFFNKFISIFKNGKSTKEPQGLIPPKKDSIELSEWEEEDKIDSSIRTEINSDIQSVIDSFRALNFNLLILNHGFQIVFASDLFLKLTDFTHNTILGKSFLSLCPEPLSKQEIQDLEKDNGAISTFKKIILETGENIPAQLYIQAINGLDEICYTVIVVPMGGKKSF